MNEAERLVQEVETTECWAKQESVQPLLEG